jgi:hypothetical protein
VKLRFGQIEHMLRIVHHIPDEEQTQFRGRLRNLKRAGLTLPSGEVGRKANFHSADLFKLAFVLELLQAGMPPEPASISVSHYWPEVVEHMFAARKAVRSGKPEARFLVAEPASLTSKLYRFAPETGAQLGARICDVPSALLVPRLLAINVAALLLNIERAAAHAGVDMDAFNADLDHHQAIILKRGARVPRPPRSGFVEE